MLTQYVLTHCYARIEITRSEPGANHEHSKVWHTWIELKSLAHLERVSGVGRITGVDCYIQRDYGYRSITQVSVVTVQDVCYYSACMIRLLYVVYLCALHYV